jgi:hypothetical protein
MLFFYIKLQHIKRIRNINEVFKYYMINSDNDNLQRDKMISQRP